MTNNELDELRTRAAHLGGLIAGFLIAMIDAQERIEKELAELRGTDEQREILERGALLASNFDRGVGHRFTRAKRQEVIDSIRQRWEKEKPHDQA